MADATNKANVTKEANMINNIIAAEEAIDTAKAAEANEAKANEANNTNEPTSHCGQWAVRAEMSPRPRPTRQTPC